MKSFTSVARPWLMAAGLIGLLSACGGTGFEPIVTGVKAQTLMYGRTATLYVGGSDLRASMVADLGPGCASPSFSPSSTPSLAILNCEVKVLGSLPLTIKTPDGQTLYQITLTV